MNDTPKWLFPAALAAAIAAALWWLFSPDEQGRTGTGKLRAKLDPNAALGAALCEGGIMYYGGVSAGMGAAPLCTAAGTALAPVVGAAVHTAADIIDAHGNVIKAAGGYASSAISNTGSAIKTVAQDTYSGTKKVVSDVYNGGKEAAGWVSGVTPAKKVWNATFGKIF